MNSRALAILLSLLATAWIAGCASPAAHPNPVTVVRVIATTGQGERIESTGFVVKDGRVATLYGPLRYAISALVVLDGVTHPTSGRTLANPYQHVSLLAVDWHNKPPAAATLVQREDLLSAPVSTPSARTPKGNVPLVGKGTVRIVQRRELQIALEGPFTFDLLLGAPVIDADGEVVGLVFSTEGGATVGSPMRTGEYQKATASRAEEIWRLFDQPIVPWRD